MRTFKTISAGLAAFLFIEALGLHVFYITNSVRGGERVGEGYFMCHVIAVMACGICCAIAYQATEPPAK